MFCHMCGKQVSDSASFCPGCGAKLTINRNEDPMTKIQAEKHPNVIKEQTQKLPGKKKKMPPIAAFLLGILLSAALVAGMIFGGLVKLNLQKSAGTESVEGTGYDSPEAAVAAYLEAMKAGDVNAMLSTFAIESYVDHYSLASYLWRMSFFPAAYALSDEGVIDTEDSFKSELNAGIRESDLLGDIWCQYTYNTIDEDSEAGQAISEWKTYPVTDYSEVQSVILALQGEGLDFSTLEVGTPVYGEAVSEPYATSVNLKNMYISSAYVYGAEAFKSLGMTFTVDGKQGLLFMNTVKYDGKWYNLNLNGNLGTLLGLSNQGAGMLLSDRDEWSELGLGDVYTASQNGQGLTEFKSSALPEMETEYKESAAEALSGFYDQDYDYSFDLAEAYSYGFITEELTERIKSVASAEDMTECNRELYQIAFAHGYDGPELYEVLTWDELMEYFSFTELE